MSNPHDICEGLDLHCCLDCARWVRNLRTPPGQYDRCIRPVPTASGKCPDWRPTPPAPLRRPEGVL